jgi:hypothetical protein
VLFGGGTKKGQDADIEEAKRLRREYKERKAKLEAEGAKLKATQAKKRKR